MSACTQDSRRVLLSAKVDKLESRIDKVSALAESLVLVSDAAVADCGDVSKSSYWLVVIDAVARHISSVLDGACDRQEDTGEGGDHE